MSLSFPRKKYYSKCQRPKITKMVGVQIRTEMWWTWPCCWHVLSRLLRGGGRVFPLCGPSRAPCLTSERLPLQRHETAWLSISAAGVWELRTQKYRKLGVAFPQRSCWVFLHVLPPEGSFISPSFQSWGWKHSWLELPVSNCGLWTTWSHWGPCVYHLLGRQERGSKGAAWARWVKPLSCILTRA